MATTTNVETLVINYLTEAQYEAAVQGGTIDEDALYLTPDSGGGGGGGITDVEVDGVSVVSGGVAEIDLTGKADVSSLATVATTGDYDDLINKPTIPDAVTVTRYTTTGTNIADIKVGNTTTKLYAPTGGGGGGTLTDVTVDGSSVVQGTVAVIDLSGKADTGDIPSNLSDLTNDMVVSDFTNDAGYLTTAPVTSVNGNTGAVTISVPTITDTYSGTSSDGMSGKAVKSAIDALDGTISGSAGSGKTLTAFSQTDGKVSATFGNISITKSQVSDFPTIPTITDTYSGTSSNGMSGKAVKSAIDALDGTVTGSAGSGKTLTAFSQTDGKVTATFGNISITKSQVSDFPSLATVATSGDYDDLTNKPTIPTITDTYSGTSSNGMSGKAVKSAIDALDGTITGSAGSGKTLTAFSQTDGKVTATFGNISITKSQISDFPTIPTVNNATLTIQKNGTTVKTFTANASSDVTANITVPTTAADVSAVPTTRTVNGKALSSDITLSASDVSALPSSTTIPSSLSDLANDLDVSDFPNDAGYLTSHQDISGKADKTDTDIDSSVTTLFASMGWVAP